MARIEKGVSCDICGMQMQSNFRYYSYDCKDHSLSSGIVQETGGTDSFDLCGQCNQKIVDKVIKNNESCKDLTSQRSSFCEMSGKKIEKGNFKFIKVSNVFVNLDRKQKTEVDSNYFSFLSLTGPFNRFFKKKKKSDWTTDA